MKRGTQLKSLFTLAIALVFAGSMFGQTAIPGWDDGAAGTNYTNTGTEATTEVTVGKTIPVYAEPDAYFHPSYNAAAGTGLTGGHDWTWGTTDAAVVNLGTVGQVSGDNYNTIIGVATGTETISVAEDGPFCSDGTPQTMVVSVLAEPTGALSTTTDLELCVGDAGLPGAAIQAAITDNSSTDFHVVWRLEIYTMSGAVPAADEWFNTSLTTLGGAQAFAADYTQAAPDQTQTAPTAGYNLTAVVPNATINSKTTVYNYTLTELNDRVSRRGDFLGAVADVNSYTWDEFVYYAIGESVSITVHPTPVTGPIFHIDNNWAE